MRVGEVGTGTFTLDDEIFTIPQGAQTIDLECTDPDVPAKFKGNKTVGDRPPEFVTLDVGQAYSFGDLNKPYGEIIIDATGTTVEVAVNY